MQEKLLSIIVPTKDRYFYLEKLIELLNSFGSREIEIVIEDNTKDNTEILTFLNEYNFPYLSIVYNHTQNQIPISSNADKAVLHSSGEYVSFIGDDDGVTKEIINCVLWMKKNKIDIVLPSTSFYSWPDAKEHQNKLLDMSGKIMHPRFTGKIIQKFSLAELSKLMKRGCIDRGGIPLLYHGIVKRSTLDKIYSICGSYFPGPSPDIANGVALSLVKNTFYMVDIPLIIAGASKFHGGGIRKMKNRAADIGTIPFLPPNTKDNWEQKIPLIWTGETIWCESAIKAMRRMCRDDLERCVNYERLYAHFAAFHYPIRHMAYKLTSNKLKLFIVSNWYVFKRYFNAFIRMFRIKLGWNTNRVVIKKGLDDIIAAANYLDKHYSGFFNNLDREDIE